MKTCNFSIQQSFRVINLTKKIIILIKPKNTTIQIFLNQKNSHISLIQFEFSIKIIFLLKRNNFGCIINSIMIQQLFFTIEYSFKQFMILNPNLKF
ncbi:unnamed protein product [Paramecium pentaurelia]|uniref:Uncharacterized protein n=1 Tax=Paramecium pentaurelia TaxID=43138 RepID=A0A8S1Y2G4_9CILI|nr:unnamed protein product [Paramecium pentaurelia]